MDFFVDGLNGILWNYVLVYALLGAGLYFTIRLGAPQFRHFGEMLRVITAAPSTDKRGITPFQALTVSLASRVGTGNLAGVAGALTLGGPGAIFWMWMVALPEWTVRLIAERCQLNPGTRERPAKPVWHSVCTVERRTYHCR